MKSLHKRLLFGFLSALTFATSALAGDFFVRDGDRVVFLGDSITEQRLYTTYIEAYTLTRHPDWKLTFRNVGWGGDTAWLRKRAQTKEEQLFAADQANQQNMVNEAVSHGLGRDVLPLNPTVVTIKFGMNDHAYQPFRKDIFEAYVRSQTQLGTDLEKAGARVAYLTPQPIEEKRSDPDKDVRNQSLRKFSDGLKEVATKLNVPFVDQFDPYMAIMMRERQANPSAFVGAGDAVHPGPAGHTMMAWIVLKGLGASAPVSSAVVDSAAQKAVTQGCRVENVKAANGVISFDRLDDSLPMPIDTRAESALKLAPILDELSQYQLQVSGLANGKYELSIDGEPAAQLNSEDLAKGVNLTMQAGPITKQARRVLELVFQKNNIYFERWRNVQLFSGPGWAQQAVEQAKPVELARLDKEIADCEAQIETARKPKSHHFELKPVAN